MVVRINNKNLRHALEETLISINSFELNEKLVLLLSIRMNNKKLRTAYILKDVF